MDVHEGAALLEAALVRLRLPLAHVYEGLREPGGIMIRVQLHRFYR